MADVEFLADGRRIAGVQVMTGFAGTDFGSSGVAGPEVPGYGKDNNRVRDVFGVVGFVNNQPVVLGFVFPQVSQMLFGEDGRMVYRHPSDVYLTIDKDGNTELAHPSGAFIRLGVTPEHEDLTGKDANGLWKISRNLDKPVNIHVEQAGGTAAVNIAPDGTVLGTSAVSITLEAPDLFLKGRVTQTGGPTSLEGDVSVKGGVDVGADVVASGISLVKHHHISATPGSPSSPSQA